MRACISYYDSLEAMIGRVIRLLSVILLGALLVIFLWNVLFRYLGISGMPWFEEMVTLCFAWMAFLGTAELWRNKELFSVKFFVQRIKRRVAAATVALVIDLVCLGFFVTLIYYSVNWILRISSTTPALSLPTSYLYCSIPVAATAMGLMTLRDLVGDVLSFFQQ